MSRKYSVVSVFRKEKKIPWHFIFHRLFFSLLWINDVVEFKDLKANVFSFPNEKLPYGVSFYVRPADEPIEIS